MKLGAYSRTGIPELHLEELPTRTVHAASAGNSGRSGATLNGGRTCGLSLGPVLEDHGSSISCRQRQRRREDEQRRRDGSGHVAVVAVVGVDRFLADEPRVRTILCR